MTDDEKAFFENMLTQVNTKMADLLDAITLVRDDVTNTKGHVVYVMEDSLTLGRRISRLEDEMRQRRSGP
jgi:hypothetical protein